MRPGRRSTATERRAGRPPGSIAARLWRLTRALLLGVAALVLFVEEWGWRPLAACAARIARWPPLARLEASVRASSPRVALALFFVPAVLLFPLKLLALWLIGEGRAALGIGVIVAAKLVGTAFVGRLFVLVEPQLMRFAWFARVLGGWRLTKDRIRAAVQRSAAWRAAHAARRVLRGWRLRLRRRMRPHTRGR